jgi:hypothetical protein
MTRPQQLNLIDTDGLQADVMRFMAIIAFVLIAILALVEKLEPPAKSTAATVTHSPVNVTATSIEDIAITQSSREPTATAQVPSEQVFDLIPELSFELPLERSTELSPENAAEASLTPDMHRPTTQALDTQKMLTLRFSSDKAFLYLIGRETIQLFGKSGVEFQRLTPGFALEPARLSGELYEVLPASLPRVVRRVFSRHADPEVYLVALPADLRTEIDRLQSAHAGEDGSLLINKDGAVHYEKT